MANAANMIVKTQSLSRLAKKFRSDESGATAIEYGLIVALIFLAIVGSVRAFTDSTSVMYDEIATSLDEA